MNHQTLYLKYRPQKLEEVIGQEEIVKLFGNVLQTSKIGHAYLFSGGRGTGKTSIARIIAKELGTNDEDIYEIDAASNRGIDEIRLLREGVSTRPFSSRYKIYIIDEAHMLTIQAANALLKTLEEPPSHAIFILATTDPQKLPKTILSRCQVLDFKKASIISIKELVNKVAKKENIEISDDSIDYIARVADGSYRDALSFLEKVLSVHGTKNITLASMGNSDDKNIDLLAVNILKFLSSGDISATLGIVSQRESIAALNTLKSLVDSIRNLLLLKFDTNNNFKNKIQQEKSEEYISILSDILSKNKNTLTSKDLLSAIEHYTLAAKNENFSKSILESYIFSFEKND